MSVIQLMLTLDRMGVLLMVDGDRLRYSPRSVVTPDLEKQLLAHKDSILDLLQPSADILLIHANAIWRAAVDRRESDPDFSAEEIEVLRAATVTWETTAIGMDVDGWPADSTDPDDLEACQKCGSLVLWESITGNWRCKECDPPTKSRRIADRAQRQKMATKNHRH